MKKILILFGSDTGNTKDVAERIAKNLQEKQPRVLDVSTATVEDVENAEVLILGTSTWGYGDMQDDWDGFLPKLANCNLSGKVVALFGLGDSDSYPDTFVNAMGTIYETLQSTGCTIVGSVKTDGYTFDDSSAVVNGDFVGLALNEDGEPQLSDERLHNWLTSIDSYL